MLIKKVKNPMIPLHKESIVNITMTLDQFYHLQDCVSFTYQNANSNSEFNSRMFLIAEMMLKDFQNLSSDLNKEDEKN